MLNVNVLLYISFLGEWVQQDKEPTAAFTKTQTAGTPSPYKKYYLRKLKLRSS